MSKQVITFKPVSQDQMPMSVGRNGTLKTSGVAIKQALGEVWLQALTSKGSEARCVIALPEDPDVIREMAAVLLMVSEDLETKLSEAA